MDLKKSKDQLENITGIKVRGYRAPTFSITDWSFDILIEQGFEIKRPSIISVEINEMDGNFPLIQVGGETRLVIQGSLFL